MTFYVGTIPIVLYGGPAWDVKFSQEFVHESERKPLVIVNLKDLQNCVATNRVRTAFNKYLLHRDEELFRNEAGL